MGCVVAEDIEVLREALAQAKQRLADAQAALAEARSLAERSEDTAGQAWHAGYERGVADERKRLGIPSAPRSQLAGQRRC